MSFFGRGFEDDPFFGDMHRRMFQQMDDMNRMMDGMMGGRSAFGMDPFGGLLGRAGQGAPRPRDMMLEGPSAQPRQDIPRHRQQQQMAPFGFGGGLLGGGLFGNMMTQMESMRDQAVNNPNAHVFTHSTVVSMGPGEYYESTNETRKNGQVKETRNTVRDSRTGEEKMTIGHHIGDRAHIIEKRRRADGNIEEEQKFHNLQQEEARDFDRFFASGRAGSGPRPRPALLGRHRPRSHSSQPTPAIEEPDDDDEHVPQPSPPSTSTSGGRRRTTADRNGGGPIIEEIHDDESDATGEMSKRPRGPFSRPPIRPELNSRRRKTPAGKTRSRGPIIEEVE